MSYLTTLYSLTTATNVEASPLNQNFSTYETGAGSELYQLDAASMTASAATMDNLYITGDRTISATAKGQRMMMTINMTGEKEILGTSSGYMYFGNSVVGSTNDYGARVMPRSGSVLGVTIHANVSGHTSTVVGSISVRKGGSAFIPVTTYSITTAASYETNTKYNRGTYAFSPGNYLGLYVTVSTTGTVTGTFAATMEVVFD